MNNPFELKATSVTVTFKPVEQNSIKPSKKKPTLKLVCVDGKNI